MSYSNYNSYLANRAVCCCQSKGATGPTGATGGTPWVPTSYIGPTGPGYIGTGYTGDAMVFGKLYVQGGIDPTYLALEPLTSDPIPIGFHGIWMDKTNGNALRSDNIYMNVEPNPAYISLKPDNNAAQIILSDGSTTTTNITFDGLASTGDLTLKSDNAVNLTSTNGNINLNVPNGRVLIDAGGVEISKETPEIIYKLNTGNGSDRMILKNNGEITTSTAIPGGGSLITGILPNYMLLQKTTTHSSPYALLYIDSVNGLRFTSPTGNTSTYTPTQLSFTTASTMNSTGYQGAVYHTDVPTTNSTYYLTFVQATGPTFTGYYPPCFDSAALTYNPSTNLLAVNGLQLSTVTNAPATFAGGTLSLSANDSSNRAFNFAITANMTGLSMTNGRVNGVYTCNVTNNTTTPWTINGNGTLAGAKASFATTTIAQGEFWVMTIKILAFNTGAGNTTYNCVGLEKFV